MRMSGRGEQCAEGKVFNGGLDDEEEPPLVDVCPRGVDEESYPELDYFDNERFETR